MMRSLSRIGTTICLGMLSALPLDGEPIVTVAPPVAPGSVDAIRQTYQQGDCATALALSREARSANPAPVGEDLATLNGITIACEIKAGDEATAYRDALAATAQEPSSGYVWQMRLRYEGMQKRYDALLTTIEAMAVSQRPALNAILPRSCSVCIRTSIPPTRKTRRFGC